MIKSSLYSSTIAKELLNLVKEILPTLKGDVLKRTVSELDRINKIKDD